MTNKLDRLLTQMGAPCHLSGFDYTITAVMYLNDHPKALTTEVYRVVAAQHDTTPSRVERAIRTLVSAMVDNCDPELFDSYFGSSYARSKDKPVNHHFLNRLLREVRKE